LTLLSLGLLGFQERAGIGPFRKANAQAVPLPTPPAGLLIIVNSTLDQDDAASPSSGVCDVDLGTPGDQCTLRAAIEVANAFAGDDTIRFLIPSSDANCDASTGACTIALNSALPEISDGVNITGPGADKLSIIIRMIARYVRGTERNKRAAVEAVRLDYEVPRHNGVTRQEQPPVPVAVTA